MRDSGQIIEPRFQTQYSEVAITYCIQMELTANRNEESVNRFKLWL